MDNILRVGDVIKTEIGMKVFSMIPSKFVYSNRKLSDELTQCDITIGKVFKNPTDINPIYKSLVFGINSAINGEGGSIEESKIIDFLNLNIKKPIPETFVLNPSEYVVTNVEFIRAYGHWGHIPEQDHYKITCRELKNGEYDKNGTEIIFNQTGSVICKIDDITPIRKMELTFK